MSIQSVSPDVFWSSGRVVDNPNLRENVAPAGRKSSESVGGENEAAGAAAAAVVAVE
jgi:hypothetical protein